MRLKILIDYNLMNHWLKCGYLKESNIEIIPMKSIWNETICTSDSLATDSLILKSIIDHLKAIN